MLGGPIRYGYLTWSAVSTMIHPFGTQALLGGLTFCTMAIGLVTADAAPPNSNEEQHDEASPASSYEEEIEVRARNRNSPYGGCNPADPQKIGNRSYAGAQSL